MNTRFPKTLALLTLPLLPLACTDGKLDTSKVPLGQYLPGETGRRIQTGLEVGGALLDVATMAEEQEDDLGRAVAIAATNRWPLFDKPALTKYVTEIGLTLADSSAQPGGNWVFGVLDTPDLGAYSGPNGYILVTRGAIAAMDDEAELAAVLAHEIAHVQNRDGINEVKKTKLVDAGFKAMNATQRNAAVFTQLAGPLTDKALTTGWNQSQETAADDAAVRLLAAAGYDPAGLPRFLARLQQREAQTGQTAGKLFSTHPGTADRIDRTTQAARGKTGATNKDRFAKAAAEAKL